MADDSRLDVFGELGQDQVQAWPLVSPAYQQESGERAISGFLEEHLPLGVKNPGTRLALACLNFCLPPRALAPSLCY